MATRPARWGPCVPPTDSLSACVPVHGGASESNVIFKMIGREHAVLAIGLQLPPIPMSVQLCASDRLGCQADLIAIECYGKICSVGN